MKKEYETPLSAFVRVGSNPLCDDDDWGIGFPTGSSNDGHDAWNEGMAKEKEGYDLWEEDDEDL